MTKATKAWTVLAAVALLGMTACGGDDGEVAGDVPDGADGPGAGVGGPGDGDGDGGGSPADGPCALLAAADLEEQFPDLGPWQDGEATAETACEWRSAVSATAELDAGEDPDAGMPPAQRFEELRPPREAIDVPGVGDKAFVDRDTIVVRHGGQVLQLTVGESLTVDGHEEKLAALGRSVVERLPAADPAASGAEGDPTGLAFRNPCTLLSPAEIAQEMGDLGPWTEGTFFDAGYCSWRPDPSSGMPNLQVDPAEEIEAGGTGQQRYDAIRAATPGAVDVAGIGDQAFAAEGRVLFFRTGEIVVGLRIDAYSGQHPYDGPTGTAKLTALAPLVLERI